MLTDNLERRNQMPCRFHSKKARLMSLGSNKWWWHDDEIPEISPSCYVCFQSLYSIHAKTVLRRLCSSWVRLDSPLSSPLRFLYRGCLSFWWGEKFFSFKDQKRASGKLIASVEPLLHSAGSITFLVYGISSSVQAFFTIVLKADPAPHCPIRSHFHTAFSTNRFSFNNWSRRYWWCAILVVVSGICIIVLGIPRSKLPTARSVPVL